MAGLGVPEQDEAPGLDLDGVVDLQQLLPADGRREVEELARGGVLEVREDGVEVGGASLHRGDVVV